MRSQIVVAGVCLMLLVGCSSITPTNITPTIEPINDDVTETEPVLPDTASTANAINTKEVRTEMIIPDLNDVKDGENWKGHTNITKLVDKDGVPAIEIDKEGFNVIWINDFNFTNGSIEFDVKGKSDPPQESFVGVAFRVMDEATFDSIYFRPFNFGASEAERRAHAVQYMSLPEWPWYRLREEKTGQYEQPVNPTPDGDEWFHAKVTFNDRRIQVFVNNANEPSLDVKELSDRTGGSVGIYCFGYGVIANLQITTE